MSNPFAGGVILKTRWCNIFGAETGGAERVLGGLTAERSDRQWYCPIPAIARYRMTCAHGHRGQVMDLCGKHVKEFGGGKVKFCPKCNTDPDNGHKCPLSLVEIS